MNSNAIDNLFYEQEKAFGRENPSYSPIAFYDDFEVKDFEIEGDTSCYLFLIGERENFGVLDSKRNVYTSLNCVVCDKRDEGFDVDVSDSFIGADDFRMHYYDEMGQPNYIGGVPQEVAEKLCEKAKEVALQTTIKENANYFVYCTESFEMNDNIIRFEIGEYNGHPVYADFNAEVRKDSAINNGKPYLSPVYNMDNDKAYIESPNDDIERILFDLPHDILEKCEKAAGEIAWDDWKERNKQIER